MYWWWKYIGIWLLLCFEWSKIPIVIIKVAQLGYYTFLPLTEKRSFSWQRAELFFFENSKFIRMPDQIHKVILRFFIRFRWSKNEEDVCSVLFLFVLRDQAHISANGCNDITHYYTIKQRKLYRNEHLLW